MISVSAWSSRWAAGTAALLLVGGSALPGVKLLAEDPDPRHTAEQPPPGEDPTEQPTDPVTDPAEPVLVVVPEYEATEVDGVPGFLLPAGAGGFTWLVDGVAVDEMPDAARLVESPEGDRYELNPAVLGTDVGRVVLAVVADPGHALLDDEGSTSQVRYVLDPRVPVEPVLPTAVDGVGREDAVVVPDVATQLVRDDAGEVVEPGTHPVTAAYVDGVATVTLTVAATEGHRLEVDGAPVETVPGAGGSWPVTLELTDVPAEEVPVEEGPDVEDPVVPRPAPPAPEATEPGPAPAEEAAQQPDETLDIAAPVVTLPRPTRPPEPAAVDPARVEAEDVEQPDERGPEGLGLMVILGGLLLGGGWLVFGTRGE
ncbi:hypothetical protein AA0Y32_14980 [Georgenia phoenicis]|uniref:hypothetical protein n=1 Tax=unclassified Georgenia TaxID=2626815 RepID=UPI0039AFA0A0